jgi:hypothetical protein
MSDIKEFSVVGIPDWEPNSESIVEHKAESQWQYCMCRTCQQKRHKMDALPGPPINYDTLRLTAERY